LCISLSPDCTKEQILLQWHHECNWLYGARMIDCVDVERYELAFKTVSKMNFNDPDQLAILKKQVYFSNLKETESGIVIAGQNSTNNNSSLAFVSDGYMGTTDLEQIRKLVTTALNEYNKEQQQITLPLYESTLNLICRLCHTMQSVGGNCCIVADGGVSPFVLHLVASLMQYTLVNFKTSQFVYNKDNYLQQLKHKLIHSLYKAGIKGWFYYIFNQIF
jgi:dynein heavy chain